MKTLFLNPPSFEDFDGGAGSRYQASREVTSFWYPVWLCYPAGMIAESRVVDAPVQKLSLADCVEIAAVYDLVVLYTSTPTLRTEARMLRYLDVLRTVLATTRVGRIRSSGNEIVVVSKPKWMEVMGQTSSG